MAEHTPRVDQVLAPVVLQKMIDADGIERYVACDANGHPIIEVEIGGEVLIQPTNDAAVDTDVWDDGAGAAAALAALNAYGNNVATGGKSNWTLKCELSNVGVDITQVELRIEVAASAAGTFFPVQVQTVGGNGVITLTDALWRRTVVAADTWSFDVDIKGNAVFRVGARASAGNPAGSAFLITAQPAGV